MVELTRWADFLGGRLALAEVHERGASYIVEVAEATAFVGSWRGLKDDRVTAAKAERTLDPDVAEARDALQVAYAKRKLYAAMFEAAQRDAAVVSRELTRRTEMEPATRRSDRWGGGR